MTMGISSRTALAARLRPIREARAGEDRYVTDVQALAGDLEVRLGCDSLLEVALTGLGAASDGRGQTEWDAPLSRDAIMGIAEELSPDSAAWAARLRGFQQVAAPEGDDRADRPWAMSGRALRWLVDRGVPVGPRRLGRIDEYVKSVVEMLDRGDETAPLGAHLNVVVGLAEDGIHLPLAEELAALAWLCSVHDEYVDLDGLLRVRDMGLRGMFG
jgi:hypothetical protein